MAVVENGRGAFLSSCSMLGPPWATDHHPPPTFRSAPGGLDSGRKLLHYVIYRSSLNSLNAASATQLHALFEKLAPPSPSPLPERRKKTKEGTRRPVPPTRRSPPKAAHKPPIHRPPT